MSSVDFLYLLKAALRVRISSRGDNGNSFNDISVTLLILLILGDWQS